MTHLVGHKPDGKGCRAGKVRRRLRTTASSPYGSLLRFDDPSVPSALSASLPRTLVHSVGCSHPLSRPRFLAVTRSPPPFPHLMEHPLFAVERLALRTATRAHAIHATQMPRGPRQAPERAAIAAEGEGMVRAFGVMSCAPLRHDVMCPTSASQRDAPLQCHGMCPFGSAVRRATRSDSKQLRPRDEPRVLTTL